MKKRTLIFDNGAYSIKAGYSIDNSCKTFLNSVVKAKNERKRVFISNQIGECTDLSGLFFIMPFQKGYLVSMEPERQIWDYVFGDNGLQVDFEQTSLIITEPPCNFRSVQKAIDEILFEEYQFDSILRVNPSSLSAYNYLFCNPSEQCQIIVDAGYSFTHVIPYCKGRQITSASFRFSVGGKALTNHLKEIVSYRQLHVMEETYVVNQCKEDTCFVSDDFLRDMKLSKSTSRFVRDYTLPDFHTVMRGYSKIPDADKIKKDSDEQFLRLNHERFALPEILFHPSDVGFMEMGLSELIIHAINQCPETLRPHLAKNIVLTGGCCLFPGIVNRVLNDVRSMLTEDYEVNVYMAKNPIIYPWKGGQLLAEASEIFPDMLATRKEYNEYGNLICQKKFDT